MVPLADQEMPVTITSAHPERTHTHAILTMHGLVFPITSRATVGIMSASPPTEKPHDPSTTTKEATTSDTTVQKTAVTPQD